MTSTLCAFCLMLFTFSTAYASHKIAFVTSYPQGVWYDKIMSGFKHRMNDPSQVLIPEYFHSEYWFRQKLKDQEIERQRILNAIRTTEPDLLLLGDDEIVSFLGQALKSFKIPIFMTGMNSDPVWIEQKTGLTTDQYSIVWERYPCVQGLKLLDNLKLKPKRIGILTNQSITSNRIFEGCLQSLSSHPEVEVVFAKKSELLADWLGTDGLKKGHVDAVFILVPYDIRNVDGVEIPIEKLGKLLTTRTKAVLVGILDVHTKIGLPAAFTIRAEDLGALSAQQISLYQKTKALGQSDAVNADHFEVNEAALKRVGLSVPKSFIGTKVMDENLEFGR